ncbi:hypothetical protein FS837_004192 [Tulasnella sp. UAMH 9824]|nr:hypothetical protein FS837_004192 [Tulasnella sp. UAMH 9824]
MSAISRVLRTSSQLARPPRSSVVSAPRFRAGPSAFALSTRGVVTKRYTSDHEWVTYDSDTSIGTVSITNYAQSALGDVVFVELPEVGTEITQGDQIGAVESVKAASDIYAPVSGIVEEVNNALGDQPGLLNKDPEGNGWLCKIKLSKPTELENLLTDEAYKKHCESG